MSLKIRRGKGAVTAANPGALDSSFDGLGGTPR